MVVFFRSTFISDLQGHSFTICFPKMVCDNGNLITGLMKWLKCVKIISTKHGDYRNKWTIEVWINETRLQYMRVEREVILFVILYQLKIAVAGSFC